MGQQASILHMNWQNPSPALSAKVFDQEATQRPWNRAADAKAKLYIKLKTAKALGIGVPLSLRRADEVIE